MIGVDHPAKHGIAWPWSLAGSGRKCDEFLHVVCEIGELNRWLPLLRRLLQWPNKVTGLCVCVLQISIPMKIATSVLL